MKQLSGLIAFMVLFAGFISCSKSDPAPAPNPNTTFLATINGASEVPANGSTATGSANLSFNTTTKVFTVTITYNGVTATAGHIHKAAVGVNGGVIFPITSLASPISYTSIPLDAAMEADLNANLYYINIHSAAFPGGEIRGQLIKQ